MRTPSIGFVLCMALAGCNTIAGVRKDMQQGGGSQQNVESDYRSHAVYRRPEVLAYPPLNSRFDAEDGSDPDPLGRYP